MDNRRGSTWSIWDLHIHTPKSIENNYGGDTEEIWELFITSLENLPKEVKVIGINDYYFIDGFEKVMQYKMEKGRLQNIDKIFPVLEFRIDTFGTASESKFQKINFHIIFNIDDNNWKIEIEKVKKEFIAQMHLSKLPEHSTMCLSIENFIQCSPDNTLKGGFNNIIPCTEELIKLIESERWRDKVFTLLGYVEWNNLEKGVQLRSFKEYLYSKVDAFFTASQDDNTSKKQEVLEKFGQKVLVHSLDIHDFDKLSKEKYQCFTWIKADKTFDGLKQIIFEPVERIRIQKNSPLSTESKTNIIDKIKIENSNKWFGEEEILLNSGLVCIIGEKGAGKTALLDLIAISNEEGIFEQDSSNPYSFYNRAKKQITGATLYTNFVGNGNAERYDISGADVRNETNKYARVRYLSLKELESYCDKNEKFQHFIKSIIHSKDNGFEDYDSLAKEVVSQIKNINENIRKLLNENLNSIETVNAIKSKELELENLNKNEPKIVSNLTEEQEKLFKQLLVDEQKSINSLKSLELRENNILEFEKWLKSEVSNIKQNFKNNLINKANGINDIGQQLIEKIDLNISVVGIDFIEKLKEETTNLKTSLNQCIIELKGQMEPLKEINKNLETEKETMKQWLENKSTIENDLKKLYFTKSKIEANNKQISEFITQRKNKYVELIGIKNAQKEKYEELKSTFESEKYIKFVVGISFNVTRFFEREDAIINHGSGNSQEYIQSQLKRFILSKIYMPEEGKSVADAFDCVNDIDFVSKVFGSNKDYSNLFKKSFTIEDFYNWLFDDYFDVNYYITYKDKRLETLSPGQKGLVLMKIFLKLDVDTKPLLIDQPEDNLDNKSVYKDLVDDFREVKKKRQIIIATHNPNLVVNTDSEQIIIAKFEETTDMSQPRIKYISGPLEDKHIRDQVCDILEGGNEAFEKREKRYSI